MGKGRGIDLLPRVRLRARFSLDYNCVTSWCKKMKSVFLRSEAPGAGVLSAGAPSGGTSIRRPSDENDSFRHALVARDLDPILLPNAVFVWTINSMEKFP